MGFAREGIETPSNGVWQQGNRDEHNSNAQYDDLQFVDRRGEQKQKQA